MDGRHGLGHCVSVHSPGICRPVVGHFCQFLHNSILNLTNDGGIEGQGEERLRRYRESVYHL